MHVRVFRRSPRVVDRRRRLARVATSNMSFRTGLSLEQRRYPSANEGRQCRGEQRVQWEMLFGIP